MKLSDMLGRWKKRRDEGREPSPAKTPEEDAAPRQAPSPQEGAGTPESRETVAPPRSTSPEMNKGDLEDVVETFQTIQEILGEKEEAAESALDYVEIPAAALVERLPESLRGPEWTDIRENIDQHKLVIDRDTLVEQLKTGRIELPVSAFLSQLPDGVVAPNVDPETTVELDLPMVVASVPPELLVPEEQIEEEMAVGEDLFTPKSVPMEQEAVLSEEEAAREETLVQPSRTEAEEEIPVEAEEAASQEATSLPADIQTGTRREPVAAARESVSGGEPTVEPAAVEAAQEPVAEPDNAEPPSETLEKEMLQQQSAPEMPEPVIEEEEEGKEESAVLPPVEMMAARMTAHEGGAEAVLPFAAEVAVPAQKGEWDGVESSLDAAASGIDINTAGVEELALLDGCGPSRAGAIVEFRAAHGRFNSIFDLLRVPGIGPSTFARMTGLSPRKRQSRHAVLARMLRLDESYVPSLPEIAVRLMEHFNATGALLANTDGLTLAASGQLAERADVYAALCVQFFRRTRRYLARLARDKAATDTLFIPTAAPPMLMGFSDATLVIVSTRTRGLPKTLATRFPAIVGEVAWRLGRRAVVRPI